MLLVCQRYIATEFQITLRKCCAEAFGTDEGWNLVVDRQDHILRFQYPKGVSRQASYVIPQVLLELGTPAEFIPRGDFLIRSFAASEFPKLFHEPDVLVSALLAKRTF